MKFPASIPGSVTAEIFDEITDPCAIFDVAQAKIIWKNAAWERFARTSEQAINRSSEYPQPLANEQLKEIVASLGTQSERHSLSWSGPGTKACTATIALKPFLADNRHFAMALLQTPLNRSLAAMPIVGPVDPLTRLPGREAIDLCIAEISKSPGGPTDFALLFLDLNGFKAINDQWGHAAGDCVLTELSGRLARAIRNDDLITRYGGDEFVLIVRGIRNLDELAPVLARLRSAASSDVLLNGQPIRLSASIGVVLSNEGLQSVAELIDTADRRMYAEKNQEEEATND